MSLTEMSIYGSVLILVILAVRVLWLDKLPKRTFPILWDIALLRLLVPFSVSSACSVYSFLEAGQRQISGDSAAAEGGMTAADASPLWNGQGYPLREFLDEPGLPLPGENLEWLLPMIWGLGCFLCAAFFVITYMRSLRRFREALPVDDLQIRQWQQRHGAGRPISVRQTDRIAAPLTYGVLRPVILLPRKVLWKDSADLDYVLQHEYVHICRRDAVRKILTAAALCIHWFNPFVWIMAGMLNRDIELACDEDVLQRFGSQARVGYAMALIRMEEKKRSLLPVFNGFSKNAIEERINLIMKYRKVRYMAVAAAFVLVLAVTLGFATSAETDPAPVSADREIFVQTNIINRNNKEQESGPSLPEETEQHIPADAHPESETPSGTNSLQEIRTDEINSQPDAPTDAYAISYMSEGMPQEEPADLYRGSGYILLIPKEEWRMYAPDAWIWEYNEMVQFWVTDYGRTAREQVTETLAADGYIQTGDDAILQKESDGRLYVVRLVQDGDRIMSLTYTHPSEPEYIEGLGNHLNAIAMNFCLLPNRDSQVLSGDAESARQLALTFWDAWLAADEAGMKACLSSRYSEDVERFPLNAQGYDAREAKLREVKGLDFQEIALGDSQMIWMEFLPSADADSLEYLTLELVKENDEMKISFYGLEK